MKKLFMVFVIAMVVFAAGAYAANEPLSEFKTDFFTVVLPTGEWSASMMESDRALFVSEDAGQSSVRVDAMELEGADSDSTREFYYTMLKMDMASRSVDGLITYEDAIIGGYPGKKFSMYIPFNDQAVPVAGNFLIVDRHLLNVTYTSEGKTIEQIQSVMDEINETIVVHP